MERRNLKEIASEIKLTWKNWKKSYAYEYLLAMGTLDSIFDYYYYDSAYEIVLRFLCNAQGWRGEDARRIKAELKEHIEYYKSVKNR